jgi:2-polyprenyl-3-methyl-5-hydroxy-6-metoxy-1,4-benzoquinol methylase
MSYYKFASKLFGRNKKILDVGCSEGLGTWLLAVECGYAKGIDLDEAAIETGKRNWVDRKIDLETVNFFDFDDNGYDGLVSFDVIEHILPKNVETFWRKVTGCLKHDGIAIIGTPNITSSQYASEITRKGHVNMYSGERLEKEMLGYFTHVFMFGANDEVVHTGFLPMAHYLIAVGCKKYR